MKGKKVFNVFYTFFLFITPFQLIALSMPSSASTPLIAALQEVKNQVRLFPKNKKVFRPARRSDELTIGDALATGKSSLADLRFNEGSLARIGEESFFEFLPNTRSFYLQRGNTLFLSPPGSRNLQFKTPNAIIKSQEGVAVFIVYKPDIETTIVRVLRGKVTVTNQSGSQEQNFLSGQDVIIAQGKISVQKNLQHIDPKVTERLKELPENTI